MNQTGNLSGKGGQFEVDCFLSPAVCNMRGRLIEVGLGRNFIILSRVQNKQQNL